MTIGAVFDFFINQFASIVAWVYNLQLPITENVSIPFGSFLLSFIALAICVRIFWSFNAFTGIGSEQEVSRYDNPKYMSDIHSNKYYDR